MTDHNTVYNRVSLAFTKLEVRDGDIVTISFPDDMAEEQMQQAASEILPAIPNGATVLCLRDGMTLDVLHESDLNELGWYKFDSTTVN